MTKLDLCRTSKTVQQQAGRHSQLGDATVGSRLAQRRLHLPGWVHHQHRVSLLGTYGPTLLLQVHKHFMHVSSMKCTEESKHGHDACNGSPFPCHSCKPLQAHLAQLCMHTCCILGTGGLHWRPTLALPALPCSGLKAPSLCESSNF